MVDERVQQIATDTPTRIAYHYGDETVTYATMNETINAYASYFEQIGIEKGTHVALHLGNEPAMIEAMYALFRLGAVVVPINPQYPKRELLLLLQKSDATYMITSIEEKEKMEQLKVQHVQAMKILYVVEGVLPKNTRPIRPRRRDKDDVAMLLFTSGTTGVAKGAMLTHDNIYANARDFGTSLQYGRADRVIATLPIFHAFALTVVVHAPIIRGARIIIVPKFSPQAILDVAKRHGATVFAGVPTMYHFLTQYAIATQRAYDFSTIRVAISGGSSMPIAMLEAFEQTFQLRVSEGYGLSEASPVTSFNPLDADRIPGSVGVPIANVEQKIVDENGKEVPVGEVGELIVRGPNVMKGYYQDRASTKRVLQEGWLYTGDVARRDQRGYYYIIDRKDDLMIVGGHNVYPREIEEELYKIDGISEAAVVGVHDQDYGEVPAAYIVYTDQVLDENDVKQQLARHLASYKIPRYYYALTALPKSATGKILRHTLK